LKDDLLRRVVVVELWEAVERHGSEGVHRNGKKRAAQKRYAKPAAAQRDQYEEKRQIVQGESVPELNPASVLVEKCANGRG